MKKLLLLIFIGIIFHSQTLKASHFGGANLSFTNVWGTQYKVTLTFYKDCSGIAAPNTATIHFECASNSNFTFNANISKLAGTGQEITQSCSAFPSACSSNGGVMGNGLYGIKEYVYETTVSIPPCTDWEISWASGTRNPSTNTVNTGNWYIPIQLNNYVAIANSSPVLNNKMIPIVDVNKAATLDYGGVDPDGDLLKYSFYAPFTNNINTSVAYSSTYNATNFLSSSTPITIDSLTGIVHCTPSTIMNAILGIKIDQYRSINGVMTKIATTYRDLTLKVIAGNNNIAPTLSGMDFTNSHTYHLYDTVFNKTIYINNPVEFDINGYDSNIYNASNTGNPEQFKINWQSGSFIGVNFTKHLNGTDSAYAHFSWIPTIYDTSSTPRCFFISIKDKACPYYLSSSKKYCFIVKEVEPLSLNISNSTICSDSSLTVIAQTIVPNPTYTWKLNGLLLSTPQNTNTFTYIGSNHTPGIDNISVSVVDSNGTTYTNNTQITNIYQPKIHNTFSDTAICLNDSILLNAGQGMQFKWFDSFNNIIGTNQTQTFKQYGLYKLYVNGGINSYCFDRDTFGIFTEVPPVVNLGNDTTLEPYQTLTLDAGAGYNYYWSTGETTQTINIKPYELGLGSISIWVMVYNIGCPTYDTINLNLITGIDKTNNSGSFNIRPNPNKGNFTLEIISDNVKANEKYNIQVYSVMGKLVYQEEVKANKNLRKTMHFETMSKGVYFIRISSKEGVLNKRFVIE